jgi:hypothetical protein
VEEHVAGDVLSDRLVEKAERIVLFKKTKMCKFYILGVCAKGDGCKFAHQKEDLCPLPDLSRTKLCKTLISTGGCNDPDCTYAHNREELRLLPAEVSAEVSPLAPRGGCYKVPPAALPSANANAGATMAMPVEAAGVNGAAAVNMMQPNLPPALWQYISSLPPDQALQLMSSASTQVATTMQWLQTSAPGCPQTHLQAAVPVMVPMQAAQLQAAPPPQAPKQAQQMHAQAAQLQAVPPPQAPKQAQQMHAQVVAREGWLHDALGYSSDSHPAFADQHCPMVDDEYCPPTTFAGHPADVAGGVPAKNSGKTNLSLGHRVVVKNTFLEVNTGCTPTASNLRHTNTWAGGLSSIDDEGAGGVGGGSPPWPCQQECPGGFGAGSPPWPGQEHRTSTLRPCFSSVSVQSLAEEDERQMAEAEAKAAIMTNRSQPMMGPGAVLMYTMSPMGSFDSNVVVKNTFLEFDPKDSSGLRAVRTAAGRLNTMA